MAGLDFVLTGCFILRYASDPEYRAKRLECQRRYREKRKREAEAQAYVQAERERLRSKIDGKAEHKSNASALAVVSRAKNVQAQQAEFKKQLKAAKAAKQKDNR